MNNTGPASTQRPDGESINSFYHLNDSSVCDKCCNGTACFVARHLNHERWAEAERQQTRVYCLGQCFAAPAQGKIEARPHIEVRSRHAVVLQGLVKGGARTLADYRTNGGYAALSKALDLECIQLVNAIDLSALRGRGGAGFPTGRKWLAVLAQPTTPKYIIANADEGDPGAYIDRFLMEDDPFALIEGMTIAAHATGASKGWIYVRAEYPAARPVFEAAIG